MKSKITETDNNVLIKMLTDKRAELNKFKSGLMAGKVKNVKMARLLRRQVAQILTKLNDAATTK